MLVYFKPPVFSPQIGWTQNPNNQIPKEDCPHEDSRPCKKDPLALLRGRSLHSCLHLSPSLTSFSDMELTYGYLQMNVLMEVRKRGILYQDEYISSLYYNIMVTKLLELWILDPIQPIFQESGSYLASVQEVVLRPNH